MGRPSKATPKRKQAIIASLQKGSGCERAARAAGTSGAALRRWRHDDPAFEEACQAATDYAVDVAENVLYIRGLKGETLALLGWLRANCPEKYHTRMRIAGDPEAPLEVAHTLNKPRLLILPSNDRRAMSEAEIIAERAAITRESMLDNVPPAEAEPVQAAPAPEPWPIRQKLF
jgi:hypothetical protein